MRFLLTIGFAALLAVTTAPFVSAQQAAPKEQKEMSLDRMNALIEAIGDEVSQNRPGYWQFQVEKVPVLVIADAAHDRMRVIVGIAEVEKLPPEVLLRVMQANFDSALDGRYAVARGVLWSMFLHPLKSLNDELFLSGVGQTVNLARTFGGTFSSGGLTFGGGDSQGLIERELIKRLLDKGRAI